MSITDLTLTFKEYAKVYPMVTSAVSLWALGTGTFLARSVPQKLWELFLRTFTTNLTIMSSSDSYHHLLQWLQEKDFANKSRTIKISNGRWGYEDTVKAMGYGNHYFMFNSNLIKLSLVKAEVAGTDRERDEITLVVLGRSHKTFDLIFKAIKEKDPDQGKIVVHHFDEQWQRASEQRPRPLDTIHLNEGVKETIIDFIDTFKTREAFNLKHGLNHQTAIMLPGPPGTGKSSIIKAIASHYKMKIHILSPRHLYKIAAAFAVLPENALVVIEDIDSESVVHNRAPEPANPNRGEGKDNKIAEGPSNDHYAERFNFTCMSDVLNAIDGLHCSHGRILIATTNHIHKLDPALLRSGRFNLIEEIGYADKGVVEQFTERFFLGEVLPEDFIVKRNLVSSDIQKHVLNNLDNFNEFINQVKEKR